MTKYRLPAVIAGADAAIPHPDIQIDDKKKLLADADCRLSKWLVNNGVNEMAVHPKSQPREALALKSQKLANPA